MQASGVQKNLEDMVYVLGGIPQPIVVEFPVPGEAQLTPSSHLYPSPHLCGCLLALSLSSRAVAVDPGVVARSMQPDTVLWSWSSGALARTLPLAADGTTLKALQQSRVPRSNLMLGLPCSY